MRSSMSAAGMPVRSRDSRTTAPPSTVASVSTRVPLKEVPMAVRQAETITASGMDGPLWTASEQVKAYQRRSGHHQAGARARGGAQDGAGGGARGTPPARAE